MKKVHFYCSPDLYKRAIENSCKIGVRHHCTIAGGKCAVIKFHHMLRVVEILWHHNSQTIWFGWQRIKGRPADWVETDWLQYVVDSQWWVVVLDRFVLGCCGVVCGVWCVVWFCGCGVGPICEVHWRWDKDKDKEGQCNNLLIAAAIPSNPSSICLWGHCCKYSK